MSSNSESRPLIPRRNKQHSTTEQEQKSQQSSTPHNVSKQQKHESKSPLRSLNSLYDPSYQSTEAFALRRRQSAGSLHDGEQDVDEDIDNLHTERSRTETNGSNNRTPLRHIHQHTEHTITPISDNEYDAHSGLVPSIVSPAHDHLRDFDGAENSAAENSHSDAEQLGSLSDTAVSSRRRQLQSKLISHTQLLSIGQR